MKYKTAILVLSIFLLFIVAQYAEDANTEKLTPVGFWKTFDEKTGKDKSIVKIWIGQDGKLKGRIEKVYPKPGDPPELKCEKCTGDRKNKPVLGMEFLWGFKGSGVHWVEGQILDPENGKTYNCQMDVTEKGEKLKVFGYIRVIFKIGRTQTWTRIAGV